MAKETRATQALDRGGVDFTLHEYSSVADGISYGEGVAMALGVEPDRLFKTLVAMVDGSPVVAIVAVSGQLSLKSLARAAGGKHAAMADPKDAQRLTGYVVGGISPFGQRRTLPVFVDEYTMVHDTVFVSAGQRGLQVEVDPNDLVSMTDATLADISA